MAPGTTGDLAKPTFAKIVASAYSSTDEKQTAPNTDSSKSSSVQPSQDIPSERLSSHANSGEDVVDDLKEDGLGELSGRGDATQQTAPRLSRKPSSSSSPAEVNQPRSSVNDDGGTQLSSDGSNKLQSFDTKSVASATTFALDEKESLRPDDSASIRAAIEEEEMFSAPGSVVTGSRVGSDLGVKPFREQFQDIQFAGSIPNRGIPYPVVGAHAPGQIPAAAIAASRLISEEQPGARNTLDGPVTPDEKLLEALQSQRDRVWVLKLEQDIIDFVDQSKEETLTLPQCNAFYRMLAHKLADYYLLDHAVAQNNNGSAVVVSRTAFCRMCVAPDDISGSVTNSSSPPPLSGIPVASSVSTTPPLTTQARKIMRRPGDPRSSENPTGANSEGASANASELGADGEGDSKPKSQLTREEREAKYAEARERIFGKAGSNDGQDASAIDENETSRSSSAAGKKKSGKKQRNLSNDDFEPRSQFPAYYNNSNNNYSANTYQGDQYYYPQYSGMVPGQQYSVGPTSGSTTTYAQYPSPDAQQPYWSSQQSAGVPYSPTQPSGYDLPAHFQRSMQSFQSASTGNPMGKASTHPIPSYSNPGMAGQSHYQPGQANWQAYDNSQLYGRPSYSPAGSDRQVPTNTPMPPYNYNQHPGMQYPNQMHGYQQAQPNANYGRPQFNPQSQAFIPSGPSHMIPPSAPMGFSQYPTSMPHLPRSISHSNVPSHTPPSYNSPRSGAQSNANSTTATPIKQSGVQNAPSAASSPSGTKPVPEITVKWGTPSHLPPKPPPPQTMEPQKFLEINKGLALQAYPGLNRLGANNFAGAGAGNNSAANRNNNSTNNN